MHDLAALVEEGTEKVDELLHRGGGGLRQRAVGVVAAVHVLGREVKSVVMALVAEEDGQGDGLDGKALQQIPREIAGAVGGDDHRLAHKLRFVPFA